MTKVFIDTNVFISYLTADENFPKASKLFNQIENGNISAYTSDYVINEVLFKILMFELFNLGAKNVYSAKRLFLKVDKVETPSKVLEFFEELIEVYGLKVMQYPLTSKSLRDWIEVMHRYKLFPTDALIAVTCRYYDIKTIATFDDDFKRVDFLEIFNFD